ncbi:hypothetical protein C817_00371 [Dorea sp. 5-2]|nr:hypothetical protein C817_00371 [Dorea sp. 5-2]
MKTISLLNLKGGVAKSFSVVNMGYELWCRGFRVLLLDNDKQGNLSKVFGRYDAEQTAPVRKLLNGDWISLEELIQPIDYDEIDIITSNMFLFGASWKMMKWLRREWNNVDSKNYIKYDILGAIRYFGKAVENSFVRKLIYVHSPCYAAAQDYKRFVSKYTGIGR